MNKSDLREKYKKIRSGIPESERARLSDKICENIASSEKYRASDTVLLYSPISSEVDVSPLFSRVISDGKTLLLPRVEGKTDMCAVQVLKLSSLKEGHFGVKEPCGAAYEGKIDFAVIPCVSANGGYRIGYGKGYYDRFLSSHSVGHCVISAFSAQLTDEPFYEEHDFLCDNTVTEDGFIK